MAEGFFVTTREAVELRLLEDFRAGRKTRSQVAELLGISERSVTRRAAKIRREGPAGVKHGNIGRRPVNRLGEGVRAEALDLARTTYAAFNLKHCHEYLVAKHSLAVSYDVFRRWCAAAGLGKRRKRRPSKARLRRERLAHEGLMIQLDGSPHKWNGRDEWCLIAGIDDATSTMAGARFFPTETTWGCFTVLRTIIERYGVPEIIYTDNAGWAGGGEKRRSFTQFVRACEELGICLVTTSSPEAKGRVERSFRTLQDRLVAELGLLGIKSMADANRYLDQVFLPDYWNKRLTVEPRSEHTRYRGLRADQNLDLILCFKYERKMTRNHMLSLNGVNYRVYREDGSSLSGKAVTAHVTEDGAVAWYYGRTLLTAEVVTPPKRRWTREAG